MNKFDYLNDESLNEIYNKISLKTKIDTSNIIKYSSSASAPTGFSPPPRCASLPRPSARRAPMPITGRWKATTATTPFWLSRRSWCGCCNDAFHPPADRPLSAMRSGQPPIALPWCGIAGNPCGYLLVRGTAAFYNPPTQHCEPCYRIIRCCIQPPGSMVQPFPANETIVVPISTVPRSTA